MQLVMNKTRRKKEQLLMHVVGRPLFGVVVAAVAAVVAVVAVVAAVAVVIIVVFAVVSGNYL